MCGLQPAFYQFVVDVNALLLPGLWFVVCSWALKFFLYFSLVAAESLFSLSSSTSFVVSWFTCDGSLLFDVVLCIMALARLGLLLLMLWYV